MYSIYELYCPWYLVSLSLSASLNLTLSLSNCIFFLCHLLISLSFLYIFLAPLPLLSFSKCFNLFFISVYFLVYLALSLPAVFWFYVRFLPCSLSLCLLSLPLTTSLSRLSIFLDFSSSSLPLIWSLLIFSASPSNKALHACSSLKFIGSRAR